jgi:small redox-active disulfide protein 2
MAQFFFSGGFMAKDEIKQIMIDDRLIGIVGLDTAIRDTEKTAMNKTDEEIQDTLVAAVSTGNYIPAAARDAYGKALLREFKIAHGLSVEPDNVRGLTILVLGMGCARCTQLESDVRDILSEMGIAADLRHITDFKEISRYGVLGSPALVVNDKILAAGEVPPKSKIRQWITEAYSPTAPQKA